MADAKAPGFVNARWFVRVAILCASCRTEPQNVAPEGAGSVAVPPAPSAAAEPQATAAPSVMAPPEAIMSAAPEASAKAEPVEAYCMTSAESIERAKPHQNAAAPFANCAVGIFAHCGGGDGERGHLCSKPLDTKATAAARKTKLDSCCYKME